MNKGKCVILPKKGKRSYNRYWGYTEGYPLADVGFGDVNSSMLSELIFRDRSRARHSNEVHTRKESKGRGRRKRRREEESLDYAAGAH